MMPRKRGFTLIEVLVALAIVTLGAAAVLVALVGAADSASHLRERQFAEWIALNRLSEIRLARGAPQEGVDSGELEYAGQRWRWRQTVLPSEWPNLQEIRLQVSPLDREQWFELRGFWSEQLQPTAQRDRLWDQAQRDDR